MKMTGKAALFLLWLGSATPIFAQTSAPAAEDVLATTQDIVVTAQRRSQRLMDVPASITALDADALESQGVQQVMDLTKTTPGLLVSKVGASTVPAIRGISTEVASSGADANVAIYIDGLYQPLANANDFRFPDLERVEVLKGPQGSLYGRNATGGAVLFITRDPTKEFKGFVRASYASFNDIRGTAYISGPLAGDTLLASLSGSIGRSDGYVRDLINGGHANPTRARDARAKLKWVGSDRFNVTLSGEYSYLKDPSPYTGVPLNGNTLGRVFGANPITTQPQTTALNVDVFQRFERYGGSARMELDLDGVMINSTTGLLHYDIDYAVDGDFSSAPVAAYIGLADRHNSVQQEFLISSDNSGGIQWIVGGNFFQIKSLSRLAVPQATAAFNVFKTIRTQALAAFVDITIPITQELTGTIGYRYTSENQRLRGLSGLNLTSSGPYPLRGDKTWNRGTPRVSLRYAVTERTNIYATYNEGFKSGLFDSNVFRAVSPERIKAYEAGVKSSDISNVTIEAAGFLYRYNDQQVQSQALVGGVPLSVVQNAARSEIYGAEVQTSARVTSDFRLSAGLSLLHAEFAEFTNAVVNRPTGVGGNTSVGMDVSGNRLPRSPSWTLSLSANYNHEFNFGTIDASATLYHSAKFYFEYDNRVSQSGYTTLDARLGWKPADSGFKLSVFGTNLTDRNYILSTFISSLADGALYARPRQIGVEAQFDF